MLGTRCRRLSASRQALLTHFHLRNGQLAAGPVSAPPPPATTSPKPSTCWPHSPRSWPKQPGRLDEGVCPSGRHPYADRLDRCRPATRRSSPTLPDVCDGLHPPCPELSTTSGQAERTGSSTLSPRRTSLLGRPGVPPSRRSFCSRRRGAGFVLGPGAHTPRSARGRSSALLALMVRWAERFFIASARLKGAVSILLGSFTLSARRTHGSRIHDVPFIIVAGTLRTVPRSATWTSVDLSPLLTGQPLLLRFRRKFALSYGCGWDPWIRGGKQNVRRQEGGHCGRALAY